MNSMNDFLSCDWGTSSFRLRYVKGDTLQFISVEDKEQGVANTFRSWKLSGKKDEERFYFFRDIIAKHINILQQKTNTSLSTVPLVISGMSSSSLGMMPLDYKETPFHANGSDLVVKRIPETGDFNHEMIIISGVKTHNDVMRGEETQLAGCNHNKHEEAIFILPGTHSKHIFVCKGSVTDFKTYMTGELFDLLCKKSILSASVEQGTGLSETKNAESFEAGVKTSAKSNLLHSIFSVRTNILFEKISSIENYYYLSGLLIGAELGDLKKDVDRKIVLVANEIMQPYYVAALQILNLYHDKLQIEDADITLIKGQQLICQQYIG
jgi:2-dehydro-3-deoxygalactonokinase